jgi:hypothetical protein
MSEQSTLYHMTQEFLEIKNQLEEMEGLDPQTIQDTLETYKGDLVDKAENVAKYIRSLESHAEMKKQEAKRLNESAKTDLNRVESLTTYLDTMMQAADLKEMTAGIFTLKYRKGSEVIQINADKLPTWKERKDLYDVTPVFKYSKTDLKRMIKDGEEIPGVEIIRNPDKLVLK